MKTPRLALVLLFVGALAGGIGAGFSRHALAARNSSGTYALPSGNPVTSGSTISSTWANSTLTDIGTELTNSLDRSGRGAMTAPLQLSSGTSSSPGLTFSAETGTGLYRNAANDIRMSVAGTAQQTWSTSAINLNQPTTVTGNLSSTGTISAGVDTTTTRVTLVDSASANDGTLSTGGRLLFGQANGGEGITSRRTVTGTGAQFGIDVWAGGVNRFSVGNADGLHIPGTSATNPGSPIGASYAILLAGSTFGSIGTQSTASFTTSVSGVNAAMVCSSNWTGRSAPGLTPTGAANQNTIVSCQCAAGAITIFVTNTSTAGLGGGPGGTIYARCTG
jgi:hypothetical protein